MTNLGTYFRTLRHTRPSQLVWRARCLLERRISNPRPANKWRWEASCPPRVQAVFPSVPVLRRSSPTSAETVQSLADGVFRHLGQARRLGRGHPDWQLGAVTRDRLWTVTLHYHAWAYDLAQRAVVGEADADLAAQLFREYVSDWVARFSLETSGARSLAWNPFAIATRLAWWIRAYNLLVPSRLNPQEEFTTAFLASLWQQAAYLHDHLEWDLRANHLMRDAAGLAWAGRFFDEERAGAWLESATRLAVEQTAEQVLTDGGHFERSPMYHLQVMEELLTLACLLRDTDAVAALRQAWGRMAEWAAWMRHPDGQIPLFNDAALNGACAPEEMLALGPSLKSPIDVMPRRGGKHFAETGMVVWHSDPWSVFLDIGPVGPDYQPGHAHADTLALECSYAGERLFVDPGVYAYDHDQRRRYDRSTAAHNTVCVDGQDSSEVWHIFRVGRRAYPRALRVDFPAGGLDATAAHDGYDQLPGRPRHSRRLRGTPARELEITDRVEGKGIHRAQGGWLLAPGWTATGAATGWLLANEARRVRLAITGPEKLALSEERCPYHPEFGREVETTRLVWRFAGELPVEVVTRIEGD